MTNMPSYLYLAIIIHHTVLGPFNIVELAGLDRPEEDEPAGEADKEHENNERYDRPEHTTTFLDKTTRSKRLN